VTTAALSTPTSEQGRLGRVAFIASKDLKEHLLQCGSQQALR
jgi:hypothetical protein